MLETLNEISLFDDLTEETRRLVERHFEPYSCEAETVIFEQGDPAVFLYLILRGSVTVQYKPYDGPTLSLTHVPAGGAVGWSAVTGNPRYTSGAVAREKIQSVRIRGADLRELVKRNPREGRELLDHLATLVSNRWKDANRQVRAILDQAMPRQQIDSEKGRRAVNTPTAFTREQQLRTLVEQLSAYVEQFHGGTVEFVSLHKNRLVVRLGGACLGCPLLPSTLHGWVEGTIHQFFPEIEVAASE